jgi:hypothetical protein
VQDDVLAKYPDRDLRVFVIWLPMLRTDARSEWPRNEIVDPRALHFWDPGRAVGATLAARDDLKRWRPVAWDIWAMYPPGTMWRDGAPRPDALGWTIIKTRNQLGTTIAALPVRQTR